MKKVTLSYRFTGEDPKELEEILGNINTRLETAGYEVFCSIFLEDYFKREKMSTDAIYTYCLKEQESCDGFVAFIKSEDRSKGMELELEKANQLGQTNILLIKKGLDFPQFRASADKIVEYETLPQLYEKLEEPSFKEY